MACDVECITLSLCQPLQSDISLTSSHICLYTSNPPCPSSSRHCMPKHTFIFGMGQMYNCRAVCFPSIQRSSSMMHLLASVVLHRIFSILEAQLANSLPFFYPHFNGAPSMSNFVYVTTMFQLVGILLFPVQQTSFLILDVHGVFLAMSSSSLCFIAS